MHIDRIISIYVSLLKIAMIVLRLTRQWQKEMGKPYPKSLLKYSKNINKKAHKGQASNMTINYVNRR